jgi:hypothetical protein
MAGTIRNPGITGTFGRDNYFGDTYVGMLYDDDEPVVCVIGRIRFFTENRYYRAVRRYRKYGIRTD